MVPDNGMDAVRANYDIRCYPALAPGTIDKGEFDFVV